MKCNYNGCSSKCKGDIDVESCNVLRAYQQGARDFAEWLATKKDFSKEWVEWHIDHWQKEKSNDNYNFDVGM